MTDLGTLGGSYSYAYGINDSGQVVGYSRTAGGLDHAFMWSGGTMTDLGTLGGTYSRAYGINSSGKIVGYSDAVWYNHAFLWSGGVMTDLTPGLEGSAATAINDSGQIALLSGNRSFLYYDGGMTDIVLSCISQRMIS
jgi:probable HAF family extracellular repeat protein